ncbi:hypothetical protein LTR78_006338 [Recurvomyces mirabilis]|uniref:Uncharacterized protein n=1 Tax=Recurvomyces mirabilis TaxID=574656 RepID=A0AAE0WL97_9PEZI|nr:hypothetical protein LTR78_006338 [Recurvomyces mirabilis]KAK5152226.1 hypothetical protein LTS14_008602 [Recurvomyces mirabilis]
MDTDKQVVSLETLSGVENPPIVLEQGRRTGLIQPTHEADKEVVSSWQTLSREENAPIPVEMEKQDDIKSGVNAMDAPSPTSSLPPPYEARDRSLSTSSSNDLASPLEPDSTTARPMPRPEDRSAVGHLLRWVPRSSRIPLEKMPRLDRPVIIPQLDVPPVGESVPFQRCYSDVLAAHDIPMTEFLSFLDGLSIAQALNAAAQGLKMLGAGISFVPIPLIPLAGRGISALSGTGSGKSSTRARLYISEAVSQYFAPRGLRLSMVKDDDLGTRVIRLPPGKPSLAPLTEQTLTDSICTRRLNALEPYVAPLGYDVPASGDDVKSVDKLARKHLYYRIGREAKDLARSREEQFRGRGFEGAVEEEKKCSRLRWLVIEEFR